MGPNGVVFLAVFLLSVLIFVSVDRLLRAGLRGLLEELVGLAPATEFYLRAFVIVLFLVIFAGVLGSHSDLKDGARFMEYVWATAARLHEIFQSLFAVLLVYVGLITVLMAALRRRQ
jgi:hypothetical protein